MAVLIGSCSGWTTKVVDEDLQLNHDVIIIDMDFGDIGCILGTRKVDPVLRGFKRRRAFARSQFKSSSL